jgi:hypothetical protein
METVGFLHVKFQIQLNIPCKSFILKPVSSFAKLYSLVPLIVNNWGIRFIANVLSVEIGLNGLAGESMLSVSGGF